jgi:hypothetical protein
MSSLRAADGDDFFTIIAPKAILLLLHFLYLELFPTDQAVCVSNRSFLFCMRSDHTYVSQKTLYVRRKEYALRKPRICIPLQVPDGSKPVIWNITDDCIF